MTEPSVRGLLLKEDLGGLSGPGNEQAKVKRIVGKSQIPNVKFPKPIRGRNWLLRQSAVLIECSGSQAAREPSPRCQEVVCSHCMGLCRWRWGKCLTDGGPHALGVCVPLLTHQVSATTSWA